MIAPEPRALAAALLLPTAEKVRDTSTSLRSAQDDKQEDASRRARRGLSFGQSRLTTESETAKDAAEVKHPAWRSAKL